MLVPRAPHIFRSSVIRVAYTGSLALLAALLTAATARAEEPTLITGIAEIRDGDTLSLGPVSIRLHGIDAPEAAQSCDAAGGGRWTCGAAATARLDALAGGRALVCTAREVDYYGRVVATCAAEGVTEDVSAVLAAEGLAWAFTEYSDDYVSLEAAAREKDLGVWQAPTQTPSDYRADRWMRAAAASPRPGCPIKGNIGNDGRRIYHTPWSPYYGRTQIDLAAGERWFCDEGEAQGAGWSAAQAR